MATARRAVAAALVILALLPSAAAAEKLTAFKLKTLEGTEQTLAGVLAGGKATLVVFFFPTCPFCNAAFPAVQKVYDTLKPEGLSMVWINVVPDEDKLIASWREKHGYTVPVLLGNDRVVRDYNLRTTPTHFLVDARGEIISRQNGFSAGDEQKLERDIRKALAP
jgi:cytochrome c biogenesis protein CcmG/thiol:disulfide interchange protein DsbE